MKWPLPLLLGYLLLALEAPVREALRLGPTAASPSLVFPLVVFIALLASNGAAMWTALLIGLAVDLTTLRGPGAIVIAGPHALGYAAAAYTILTLRHTGIPGAFADMHAVGWSHFLPILVAAADEGRTP